MRDAALSEGAIKHRVRAGDLVRVRSRVYADPIAPESFEQRVLSGVLAAGPTAFASHATAARLWRFGDFSADEQLEVTTVLEHQPRVARVRMHRSGLLVANDLRTVSRIPTASAARTVVDLSGRMSNSALGRLLDDALRVRVTTLAEVAAAAARLPRAPGRAPKRLQTVLRQRTGESESHLEDFVLAAIRRYRLPEPVLQHEIEVSGRRRRVDLCYVEAMLALEAQGFEYHRLRSRFDDDALRGNELQLAGFRVLEFTAAFDDWTIARQVASALGLAAAHPLLPRQTFAQWRAAA
jgi:hypothetical protein